jgi:hypothetical protein
VRFRLTTRRVLGLAAMLLATTAALAAVASASPAHRAPVSAHASAVCADYPNQAAAQRAADTRDADGDGAYCESLPCPCAGPGAPSSPPAPAAPRPLSAQLPAPVRGPEHHVL